MEFVCIGKIVNTFGLRGDLKIISYSDFDSDRYKKGSTVYVGENHIPFVMNTYKIHKGSILITFKDNLDINLVEKYKNMNIYKAKEDIKPLKKGEYFFSDLKDLNVYCENELIGKVKYVEEGTRNNNLRIVKVDKTEVLVPFIQEVFIKNVDLENKRIDIVKMEGLL